MGKYQMYHKGGSGLAELGPGLESGVVFHPSFVLFNPSSSQGHFGHGYPITVGLV